MINYELRSLGVLLSCPKKCELSRTIDEIKKSINLAKEENKSVGFVEFTHLPRKRWRVTYLKSRFKHRKAIRHYVFEQYNYNLSFYQPKDLNYLLSSILGSLQPSIRARCTFSWDYPRKTNNQTIEDGDKNITSSSHCANPSFLYPSTRTGTPETQAKNSEVNSGIFREIKGRYPIEQEYSSNHLSDLPLGNNGLLEYFKREDSVIRRLLNKLSNVK